MQPNQRMQLAGASDLRNVPPKLHTPGGRVSWRGLVLFTSVVSLFSLGYAYAGLTASPLAEALFRLATPLAAALWVEADARRLRRMPCHEFGAFVLFGWPIAVPWYCFWTRGRRGWSVGLGLIALILAPSIVAAIFS